MKILILHLSDMHIKDVSDPILNRGGNIAKTVYPYLANIEHVFIVASGDIAYSGLESEYNFALGFFENIKKSILSEKPTCIINYILTPGNHDCDFNLSKTYRDELVNNLNSRVNIDKDFIDLCTSTQKAFFDFRELLEGDENVKEDDKIWRKSEFLLNENKIVFYNLNIPWCSKKKENQGELFFPVNRYKKYNDEKYDFIFTILHHPFNWFSHGSYNQLRRFIRQISDVVMTGHEHIGNSGTNDDTETGKTHFMEGCNLQNRSNAQDSSFNIAVLDMDSRDFEIKHYFWSKNFYDIDETKSINFDINKKSINDFRISDNYWEIIIDSGSYIKHPNKEDVSLSDIFIYPDLRRLNSDENNINKNISSKILLNVEELESGILIRGEDKCGLTSLLRMLYLSYHDMNYVPLIIDGSDIKGLSDRDINEIIKRAFKFQYNETNFELYNQLSKKRKILLLDDFDECKIRNAQVRNKAFDELRKRFFSTIVTVEEMYEIREIIEPSTQEQFSSLKHYQVLPFGQRLRNQLVKQWFCLNNNGSDTEGELLAKRDRAEKEMDIVMGKMLVPRVPLYLITLLQSIDAGQLDEIKQSALGHYYHYLLTSALGEKSVKAKELNEIFSYMSSLAWEFKLLNKKNVTKNELEEFNRKFSATYHKTDFKERLSLLLDSRILSCYGDEYKFRYPYIYYYLKGMYINDNLYKEEIKDYVNRCCNHLYIRDNANTILFLAHHSKDNFILNSIDDVIKKLFSGFDPLKFDKDVDAVQEFINDAPKLIYTHKNPEEYRAERDENIDDVNISEDNREILIDEEQEEETDDLSLIAKLTMLFKTVDILGQILKNQYATIPRVRKKSLLKELFEGPLRSLSLFYKLIENNPESLVLEIEDAIRKKGDNLNLENQRKIARQTVAFLVEIVTSGFIIKTANSVSSENLRDDISELVQENQSLAFQLIELGTKLDVSAPIPKGVIRDIKKKTASNFIVRRLIARMVIRRLYLFHTDAADMQFLNSELDLDLQLQKAISYHDRDRKLIKKKS